ncbi:MAG: 50S ribosomal protein L23 [Pseudomonadota bacterium]|nr:50S ribosomal protein L23 [Pseudomonadota bacterium]
MNRERIMQILVSPHLSEKSTTSADALGQHVFRVLPNATKREIKGAVETLFKVKVQSVNVVSVKGKRKRHGQRAGIRSDWKKAYVRLESGQDIDFAGAE